MVHPRASTPAFVLVAFLGLAACGDLLQGESPAVGPDVPPTPLGAEARPGTAVDDDTQRPSDSSLSNGTPLGDAPPANVDALPALARTKLFAAFASAAYCGKNSDCEVSTVFEEQRSFLKIPFDIHAWQAAFVGKWDPLRDAEGYVFFQETMQDVVIAIRGSEALLTSGGLHDWMNDVSVVPAYFSGNKISGMVHMGFLTSMYGVWHDDAEGILAVVRENKLQGKRFWVTGHSLGGATAILVGAKLHDSGFDVAGIYTYGAPKMAYYSFQFPFNKALGSKTFQYTTEKDPIPRIVPVFASVGQNFLLLSSGISPIDKDGAPTWDPATAASLGDPLAHRIGKQTTQGYARLLAELPP